jgi:hypothetical protein
MTVDKMSVSLAPSLSSAVRDAAIQSGESLSGWIADAAATKLRARALDEFLDTWENENGAITDAELYDATFRLGLAAPTGEGWSRFVKLNSSGWDHKELVAMITRIIEGGHTVLISEQDTPEISSIKEAGTWISFERAEVRVGLPAE